MPPFAISKSVFPFSLCEVCGSRQFGRETVDDVFFAEGHYVLVQHIPATVCMQCSEKTFDAETTEGIRQMLHGRRQPPTCSVAMDVYAY